ncbi:redox-sensitive transcriptional activator SoxR [Streptomyces sp. ISL-98]|uniref:redox-sensitive transcriptional activator SoxR n=1 Tax=Streptomyces sp. ISL-98 TaxID=2819192 RepID=UPI001BE65F0F|nr:redox-sensitive transcriptional activator SoxR [Streptomyces sp. ISL-98]MBT2507464.1 redox-sensitive transcriptional activator SoxR [Streptomyces sp. ISL-98]
MTLAPRKAAELTVGELAERSGVTTSALRFYEDQQLIFSRRTSGNQRRYSRDMLRRVAFVRASQRVGIALDEIRAALKLLPDERTPTREDWARVSELWRHDLNVRIKQLQELRDDLSSCIGCGCLSLGRCALVNPGDIHRQLGKNPTRLTGG